MHIHKYIYLYTYYISYMCTIIIHILINSYFGLENNHTTALAISSKHDVSPSDTHRLCNRDPTVSLGVVRQDIGPFNHTILKGSKCWVCLRGPRYCSVFFWEFLVWYWKKPKPPNFKVISDDFKGTKLACNTVSLSGG